LLLTEILEDAMTNAALKYDFSLPDRPLPAVSLRRWLHGRWALLFSHPDDFASYGFESDRWLVHVREAFAATGIRPLALASGHEAGWVTDVGGCTTCMAVDEIQRYPVARASSEETLRAAAFNPAARFVMVLDDGLRLRRTFVYTLQANLPSPIDLAAAAKVLRDSSHARRNGNAQR
jgi:hypothetical protein